MVSKKTLIYILLSIFTIIFSVIGFDGYYFYDDYSYSYYAHQLQKGTYQISTQDIFAHRWGIIAPLALLYAIFGVSDAVNIALPLIASLVSLWFLWQFTHYFSNPTAGILALLLGGLDFYTLFFSNKLYPDVLLTTLALASVWVFLKRCNSFATAFWFIFLSFWAFLCKELLIYFLPFYIGMFVWDIRKKQNLVFWVYSAFLGLVFLIAYLGLYKYYTGGWLYRFTLIQDLHYTVSFSYFDKPLVRTFQRITYEPLMMFVNTGLVTTMAGGLVMLFYAKSLDKNPLKQLVWLLLWALAMFWFFTTSFQYYNPIGLFPRHILFLMPFFALLSGYAISLQNKKISLVIASIWAVSGMYAYTSVGLKYTLLYGILALSIMIILFIPKLFNIYTIFFGILLLAHPLYTMLKPTETGYQDEKKLMQSSVVSLSKPSIIFTDDKLATGYLWYYGFEKKSQIEFREFTDFEKYKDSSKDKYVLVNEYSIAYFTLIGYPPPVYVQQIAGYSKKIAQIGKVSLFKLP